MSAWSFEGFAATVEDRFKPERILLWPGREQGGRYGGGNTIAGGREHGRAELCEGSGRVA